MEGGGDTRTKEEEENPLEVKIIKDQEGPPLVHISSSYSRGKILDAIRNLSEKYTDSAIVTNGMVLPVHSWVVGTFSKTLAEAFGRATLRVFRAPTDDVEVVTSLVNCMYRNTNSIRKSQLCSFLGVARQLGMTCFDTPALRSLEERLLAKEDRASPGQPPQQQDLHSDPELKEILKCLTKLPNLSITCKSQAVPRDVLAGGSQATEDKLTPAPRQDEERCCCRCRCKKETGDDSCALDERVDNEKEFRLYKDSLAKKLSTFGTTISGQGALINLPAHLISSGCISIKPVSTTTTNNNNNNNNTTTTTTTEEEPELLAHFKTTAPPQRHSTMGPPHSNTPIYPSRRLGRDAGRGVVPSRKIVQDGNGARHGSDGMLSHQGLQGERLCEGVGGARQGGGLGGVTPYGRSSGLRPGGGPTSIARGGMMLGGQEVRYKPPEAEKNSKSVYQGRIPKLQQHTQVHAQHTQHTLRPSQHTQHTPQLSQYTQHTPQLSQHTQRSSQHTQHTPELSQHTQHTLQLSQHTPQLSQHTEHTPQVSQHTQHTQRLSQHTQYTPHNSRHSQVYSQAMQHTPQASQHTQNQQHTKRTLQLPQPLRTLPGTPQGHQKLHRGRGRGSTGGFGRGLPLQEGAETVMPAGVQRGKRGRPRKDAHVSIPAVDADVLTLNTPIEILGTNLVMELNDNTFDIIEGGVTLPDCFATVNTATAQSQEPAAVESSAAATPQQHMQLDTEEQGSAAEKDYSSSRLSFGSNVGSSSFESFINNEDVQDSDTLVTVPSQPGPTSSVGQEQLDGHEGGLPSGPTSNVGQGQHGGHEGGLPSGPSSSMGQEQPGVGEELLPSGPSSSVGQEQPGGGEELLPSGPSSSVGQEQPGGGEELLPSGPSSSVGQEQPDGGEELLPSGPSSSVGQEQPGGGEELLPSGPSSSVGQEQPGGGEELLSSGPSSSVGQEQSGGHERGLSSDHSISVGQGQPGGGKEWLSSGTSSSVAEKQQLPSSPCSSVGQEQLDSDKEEVPTGLSSSVEQEQQASPGHSSSVAEKQQLPSSPCSNVGQSQLDSDEDLPCLTVPSQELPLSEKNTKARRKENHKCPTCHLSLPSAFSLLLHRRQHNGQEHFHCSSCDFRNPFRQNLEAHVRKKHSRKLKDTEKKRKRAASVSPGVKEAPVKKVKENIPKNKRKLVRQSKRVKK